MEDHIGQPLFRRIGRRIELVDAGHDFLITVQYALEELRHGVRRLNAYSKLGSVIVMMPAALATGWFIPRLAALRQAHPWVDPWVHTSDAANIPEEAEIDIVLGPLPWADPRAQSLVMAQDRLVPLCSPNMASRLPDLPDARRLDAAPLLHDETLNDWQTWFAEVGSQRSEFAWGYNFSDTRQMMQAAIMGLGVCLASERLAHQQLLDGRLVIPVRSALARRAPLCMSAWTRNLNRPPVEVLWGWIRQECAAG